jgi:hypothetical protein
MFWLVILMRSSWCVYLINDGIGVGAQASGALLLMTGLSLPSSEALTDDDALNVCSLWR